MRYTSALTVDVPLIENCLRSNLSLTCLLKEFRVNPSITLAKCEVRVIGLKSFSTDFGGLHLGKGCTIESLIWTGKNPCSKDEL